MKLAELLEEFSLNGYDTIEQDILEMKELIESERLEKNDTE